jgi:hypothetical protein
MSNTNLEQNKNSEIDINNLIDDVKKFSNDVNQYKYENLEQLFNKCKEIENDEDKQDMTFNYLKNTFVSNMEYIKKDYDDIKKTTEFFNQSEIMRAKYEENVEKLKNEVNLYKRNYEYSFSEYNRMLYEIQLLKYFLIFTIFLFIIPILKLTNVLNDTISTVAYFLTLSVGIGGITYLYYKNNVGRDGAFFRKINFKKPDTIDVPNDNVPYDPAEEDEDLETREDILDKQWNDSSVEPTIVTFSPKQNEDDE